MKHALLGGALAFALWGGAALANDTGNTSDANCPTPINQSDQQQADQTFQSGDCAPVDQQTLGTGGSGESGQQQQPADIDRSYGGSGEMGTDQSTAAQPTAPVQEKTTIINVEPQPANPQALSTDQQKPDEDQNKVTKDSDMRGVTVLLGGGVEGYTGGLAPEINPGPSWGVGVALRPTKVVGVELGYSGAVNSIDTSGRDALTSGNADIVRNGGAAVATVGLSAAPVQPYLLGGLGFDRYDVRHNDTGDFRNDTVGNVPLGVGLRTQVSKFTADLRGTYGVLFSQNFAEGEGNTHLTDIGSSTPTGRFGAQLRVGATF